MGNEVENQFTLCMSLQTRCPQFRGDPEIWPLWKVLNSRFWVRLQRKPPGSDSCLTIWCENLTWVLRGVLIASDRGMTNMKNDHKMLENRFPMEPAPLECKKKRKFTSNIDISQEKVEKCTFWILAPPKNYFGHEKTFGGAKHLFTLGFINRMCIISA